MKQRAVKAAATPVNKNLELLRLELEKDKFALEKSRLEHQKTMDGQRLTYDTKKAPPYLTLGLAIAAVVISAVSPMISGYVQDRSARLAFEGKVMELKDQRNFNEADTRLKVTSFLMNNWRDLNKRPPEEKQLFASLIAGYLPERQSIQLLDTLERTSQLATKAIWREAKALVVSTQPSVAETALQVDEKTAPAVPESKAPETFRGSSSAHSTSPLWANSAGTFSVDDITKPNSGLASLGGWNPPSTGLDNNLAGSRGLVVPVAFKETPGLGNYSYLNSQPSYPTSVGLQITATPNALGNSQVTITLTDGQMPSAPYRSSTPGYLNLAGASNPGEIINVADLLAGNGSTRSGLSFPLDTTSFVGSGVMVRDSKTGLLTTKTRAGADASLGVIFTGDANNGPTLGEVVYSGVGATTIKIGATGYSSILNTQPDGLSPNGAGVIKLEKTAMPVTDIVKPRVQ